MAPSKIDDHLDYRELFEDLNIALFVVAGHDGTLLAVNQALVTLLGYSSREALLGRQADEVLIVGHAETPSWAECVEKAQHRSLEMPLTRVDGSTMWVALTIRARADHGYQGAFTDITERREAQEAYRALVENSPLGLVILQDDRVVYANPSQTKLFGMAAQGMSLEEVIAKDIHPDDQKRILQQIRDRLSGKALPVNGTHKSIVNGQVRWSEVWSFRIEYRGRPALQAISLDITERRELADRLFQAEKMEAVGRLAGGIAHDFNNLLMVILTDCELILQKLPGLHPLREEVQEIRNAASRATELTGQLLAFSRKQVLLPKVIDLNEFVRNTHKLLRRLLGEGVALATQLAPWPLWLKIDPSLLTQVVMNLAINARDAMPHGGRLTIDTAEVKAASVGANSVVALQISDTGLGISPEVKSHIFEPYMTTKAVGKGTGLGLATVLGIVEQSGGSIEVDSTPGAGTTFRLVFPKVEPPAEESPRRVAPDLRLRGTETILLVEDELAVRRVLTSALEGYGYRVLAADDAQAALAFAARDEVVFQLLITDVVMPGLSGPELAEQVTARRPSLKVLFMSGYTADSVLRRNIETSHISFLAKPFAPEALARKVREVLDAAPSKGPVGGL